MKLENESQIDEKKIASEKKFDGIYVLRTNTDGLASPEIATARPGPDALRILVTGDAFTMPEGVAHERSWTALMRDALAACLRPRAVQVINAGVTGYGPREEAAQLAELGVRPSR